MRYIGLTGRPFRTRYQEYLRDFKYNNYKSKFAQHLLEKQDAIDKMENIMNVLHITDKGQMMNTIERYYIYRETKMDNQINNKLTVQPNAIFETIVRHDTQRAPGCTRPPNQPPKPTLRSSTQSDTEQTSVMHNTKNDDKPRGQPPEPLHKLQNSNNHNIHNQNRQHMHTISRRFSQTVSRTTTYVTYGKSR